MQKKLEMKPKKDNRMPTKEMISIEVKVSTLK